MNKTIKEIAILIYVTILWVVILITIAITPRDDEKMKYIEQSLNSRFKKNKYI